MIPDLFTAASWMSPTVAEYLVAPIGCGIGAPGGMVVRPTRLHWRRVRLQGQLCAVWCSYYRFSPFVYMKVERA